MELKETEFIQDVNFSVLTSVPNFVFYWKPEVKLDESCRNTELIQRLKVKVVVVPIFPFPLPKTWKPNYKNVQGLILPIFRMCVKFYPVKFIRRFG
jgi:hypothetical protein